MKFLTDKRLALIIIAASLLFLLQSKLANRNDANDSESHHAGETVEPVRAAPRHLHEKVVYTCRFGDEEIPGVQISEIADENGRVYETVARATVRNGIEIAAAGVAPTWDYKSIKARSGNNTIDVAYKPQRGVAGNDWVLTLEDNNTYFKKRVKGCTEVSDE